MMSSGHRSLNAPLIGGSQSDDPFYAFRDELQLHVQQASSRFSKWKNLLETTDTSHNREFKEEHQALKKELNNLQSNVNDLEQVLQRVQTHRSNFAHISDEELMSRQAFIREMKNEVSSMKGMMNSPQTLGKIDQDQKKDLMRRTQKNTQDEHRSNNGIKSNSQFMEDQQQQQQLIMRQQDEHLDELEQGATRLGHMAVAIGEEIDQQNLMLDELHDDIGLTSGRMEAALTRMDKMLKSNDRCQTWTILSLICILLVLILLVAWT